jgi:hypothetical protein
VFGCRPTAHKPRAGARKIFLTVRKIAAGQQPASTTMSAPALADKSENDLKQVAAD